MKTGKLTDRDFDKLDDFLSALNPKTQKGMNVEELDGYLFALHCLPKLTMPSEFLIRIIGDGVFENKREAIDFSNLVMQHWNFIGASLDRELTVENFYEPVWLVNEETGLTEANRWAQGFLKGLKTQPAALSELINDEARGGAIIPIMMFAHEHDPDPTMRGKTIAPEKRDELLKHLIAGAYGFYKYFENHRQASAGDLVSAPMRRAPKVGRNEPCPCGSGKKYKHCCLQLDGEPTLH